MWLNKKTWFWEKKNSFTSWKTACASSFIRSVICLSADNQTHNQRHPWLRVDTQDWERVHIHSEVCGVPASAECPATWWGDAPPLPGVVSRSGPSLSQRRWDGGEEGKIWMEWNICLVLTSLSCPPLSSTSPPHPHAHHSSWSVMISSWTFVLSSPFSWSFYLLGIIILLFIIILFLSISLCLVGHVGGLSWLFSQAFYRMIYPHTSNEARNLVSYIASLVTSTEVDEVLNRVKQKCFSSMKDWLFWACMVQCSLPECCKMHFSAVNFGQSASDLSVLDQMLLFTCPWSHLFPIQLCRSQSLL